MIPTLFPATTAAASGPVLGMALLFPDPREAHEPGATTFSLAPIGVPRQARIGGVPLIATDVLGEWLRPASLSPGQTISH